MDVSGSEKNHGRPARRPARSGAAALALAGALAATPGCGRDQPPDRTTRPAVGPVPELELPAVERFALDNGLEVLLLEKHEVPLVQVNLHVRAGSVRDEAGTVGLADLTADMLDEGAAGRAALDIAGAFERLGARFNIGADLHLATLSLRVPVARLEEALALMADVALHPDFPAAELDRLRQERLTFLIRRRDEPNRIAGVTLEQALFGATHPYGRGTIGDAATLRAIGTDDVRAFYDRYYRPNNAAVVVVGDVTPEILRQRLEAAFGAWTPGDDVAPVDVADAEQVHGRTVYLVDKPGAAQSVIRIGRIGPPRDTDDYYALQVMNTILGGSFTSRLNQNLREDKGYTYGAGSNFDFRPAAGPFIAAAAVQTNATGASLREFMNELQGILEPIPEEEVERARSFLAMRYPAAFQSVAGIARRLADIVRYGIPDDEYNRYTERILAVTKADVERVAHEYIDPENLAIIVVGDREAIEAQVREQALGDIRFLDVSDVLGPPPMGTR
ncbi:MAG TPA: pitrilysin family protein [Longimicrobiales bacterium]